MVVTNTDSVMFDRGVQVVTNTDVVVLDREEMIQLLAVIFLFLYLTKPFSVIVFYH